MVCSMPLDLPKSDGNLNKMKGGLLFPLPKIIGLLLAQHPNSSFPSILDYSAFITRQTLILKIRIVGIRALFERDVRTGPKRSLLLTGCPPPSSSCIVTAQMSSSLYSNPLISILN